MDGGRGLRLVPERPPRLPVGQRPRGPLLNRATARLRRVAVDVSALRESRDFRLLMIGQGATGIGTQVGLVALPYQVFLETRSPALVGVIGIVELGPLIGMALLAGALADRVDRRALLVGCQLALAAIGTTLAVLAAIGSPPLAALYVLAGAAAGGAGVERVSRGSLVPNVVSGERLRSALSFNYGLAQLTMVVGPALGGGIIAAFGLAAAYGVDAVSCAGMVLSAALMSPQPPKVEPEQRERILGSIADGLRFVRRSNALVGSFVVDLLAMTFGMPRALFPVLALTVYHAGAAGNGALYAAVAAGATIAALTTGWLERARYLGRIVLVAVLLWGLAIAAAGVMTSLIPALVLFALAGAADSVSAVCRSTITQTLTPDRFRGRTSAVYSLVVAGGPRLGDVEAGAVASAFTPRISVISGGLACVAGLGLVALAFPGLAAYDGQRVRPIGEEEETAAEAARGLSAPEPAGSP